MMTVSITRNSSNANWSWRRTPSFFGRVTEPCEGSISPRQNLHQRGFARAIRPGDGVAAPGEERTGDVLEETPCRQSAWRRYLVKAMDKYYTVRFASALADHPTIEGLLNCPTAKMGVF